MIISTLKKQCRSKMIPGQCPKCDKVVYESMFLLDDAYAVWAGLCPYCGAICLLDTAEGYHSGKMYLTLPHNEEVIMLDLPPETPTKGWHRNENAGLSKEELIKIYS